MAVDVAGGHIFFSQGSAAQGLVVTDLSGQNAATIQGTATDTVMGIALSPDGSTLYAAVSSADEVIAISTSSLTQTATYSLGTGNSPRDVVPQDGLIWVSYNTGTAGAAAVGDIDPTNTTTPFQTQANMGSWDTAPALAADPSDSGTLVAVDTGQTTGSLVTYDTAVNPATVIDHGGLPGTCENAADIAVLAGGADFVIACGYPYEADVYSTATLTAAGSYPASLYTDAVAMDSSGDLAVGGAAPNNGGPYAPDVSIYKAGGSTPVNEFGVNIPYNGVLMDRGLALSPDGSELFAVVTATFVGPTTYTLETVTQPLLTRSTLTLTGPSSASVTHAITLTGNLSLSTGPVPAGTAVTVKRTEAGSTATNTFALTTATGGIYQLTDTPPATGTYTYTATYAGSSTIASANASQVVTVSKLPVALSLSSKPARVSYDSFVHLTVHLGATFTARTVHIYVHDLSKRSTTLLRTVTVSRSGSLTFSYKAPHSAIFTATFAGDAHYAAKTVTHRVNVLARVSQRLTGYYAKSGKYYLFHASSALVDHATVAPNKHGECVMFETQEYVSGSWLSSGTFGCFRLSSVSTFVAKLGLGQADHGFPYRIRVDFVHSSADQSNASNDSSWLYLKVES